MMRSSGIAVETPSAPRIETGSTDSMLVSVHRLPNAVTGRTRRCNRLHETFSHQSHARHPRLSTEASERHGRRRAGAHACQPRIHRCAARPAQGTRGGVRPAGAHRGVPETYLSDVESSAPTAHRRLTPPHPPTSAGVIPLARRRRRHHDARARAVRPRRSVSPLSAWARAWGLPKRRRRLSSSRATFVVRLSFWEDPAERFGKNFFRVASRRQPRADVPTTRLPPTKTAYTS